MPRFLEEALATVRYRLLLKKERDKYEQKI